MNVDAAKYQLQIITPQWHAPSKIKAITTTSEHGFSTGQYNSFNPANHVGDNNNHVKLNRELLELHTGKSIDYIKQTHGNKCVRAIAAKTQEADAVYSRVSGQICCVLTADCLPILLTNKKAEFVAAIHAGWRGLATKIISNSINKIAATDIIAWIGPAICKHCYAVGPELMQIFLQNNTGLKHHFNITRDKIFADLTAIATFQLQQAGVRNITDAKICTYPKENRLFSARRDGLKSGRIASCIWIES